MEKKQISEVEKELIARLRSRIKDAGAEETLDLVLKPNKETVYADASPIDKSISPEPKNPESEIDMAKEWKDYLDEKLKKDMSIANLNIEENMAGLANSAPASNALCSNPYPYTGSTIAHIEDYEMVNHPKHYNSYDVEVVDMMRRIWGSEKTAIWCELNAFKYRMRMGLKPGSSFDDDLAKEQWYLNKAKEIRG